jgi:hypothetical protein
VPLIKDNKIFYSTKELKKSEQTPQEKVAMAGKMMSAGSRLMDLQGGSKKPVGLSKPKTEFSMPSSPFQTVPTLSIKEGDG